MSPVPAAFVPARITQIEQRFSTAPMRSSTAAAAFGNAMSAATATVDGTLLTGVAPLGSNPSLFASSSLTGTQNQLGAQRGQVTGDDVVATATKYLGIDYKWGGTDPNVGLDCSGLVQRVFGDLGIDLPRVSRDQARTGTAVASIEDAKPGDLLAFGNPVDHIGIYVGDGKMLHAPRTGDVVKVGDIRRDIVAIRRVVPETGAASANSLLGAARPVGATASSSATIAGAAPYQHLFEAAGAKYGFNPNLLAAIAKTESNFNPSAVSSVGATGLMQFMPATAASLGVDPKDPAQAVDGAAKYLRQQYDRFGSVELALAAYNAGPGNVSKYGGVPPFTETRNYVSKVTTLLGGASPFA